MRSAAFRTKSLFGRYMISLLLLCGCTFFANKSLAQDPIPQESGVSGFFRPGLGVFWVRSNMIAGNRMLSFGNSRISSLYDQAEPDVSPIPIINFDLRYTFSSSRTQVFVGGGLEDLVRFVLTTQIGVRQELPDSSILSLSYLFSAVPTKVWTDPYVIDQDRIVTQRHSPGVRLNWNRVLGSHLQLRYTYRKIDLAEEQSGAYLGLPEDQAVQLYRDGKQHTAEILYRFNLGDSHWLVPALRYERFALSGKAMSNHLYSLQLTYTYLKNPVRFIANGLLTKAPFDEENPIYQEIREDTRFGLTLSLYYLQPFGWRPFGLDRFNVFCTFALFRGDSNIKFYDFYGVFGSVGMMFRF